jgi:hypothetical protein
MGELSMSDARLAAANRIIAAQNRALAKAHAALTAISRNPATADEWLVPVHTAIAEIEGSRANARAPINNANALMSLSPASAAYNVVVAFGREGCPR